MVCITLVKDHLFFKLKVLLFINTDSLFLKITLNPNKFCSVNSDQFRSLGKRKIKTEKIKKKTMENLGLISFDIFNIFRIFLEGCCLFQVLFLLVGLSEKEKSKSLPNFHECLFRLIQKKRNYLFFSLSKKRTKFIKN